MAPNRGLGGNGRSRLKPVNLDPLDAYGLPSKGDTRLLDSKTQERYYTKIVERYLSFCSDAGNRDVLLERFASLSLADKSAAGGRPAFPTPTSAALGNSTKDLSDVLMALRKLREGIVASKRLDDFAVQAYLFCIRLAVLVKQSESYHPAILHLLRFIHRRHPLTTVELREVVGYLVLDMACRQGDLSSAYILRRQYGLRDPKVDATLVALAQDNWVAFRRIKDSVDGHRARLLEYAEDNLRSHTLKAFGRTYLHVDIDFLEASTGKPWTELQTQNRVGWERDGQKVIIRKIQARK